jgi:hypothetical protein
MVMAFAVPAPNPTSTSSYVPCSLVSNIDFDNEHVATDTVAYIAAMRRRWTRVSGRAPLPLMSAPDQAPSKPKTH